MAGEISIAGLYPDNELIHTASPDFPDLWNEAVCLDLKLAGQAIANALGVPSKSEAYSILAGTKEVAVLRPKRKGRRAAFNCSLALRLNEKCTIAFGYPRSEFLFSTIELPTFYRCVLERVGAISFDGIDGLIWPSAIHQTVMSLPSIDEACIPFYDHATGDFDCFTTADGSEIKTYNHELSEMEFVSSVDGRNGSLCR